METKDFDTLVSEQATAIQGTSSALIDFSVGSVLRAVIQAITTVVLWLQAMALQILGLSRASTSTGADLDSWMADFGIVERIPAQPAIGTVTFARYTTGQAASIPVGTVVQTADGSQKYAVILDTTNPAYDSGTNSYIVSSVTQSIDLDVQAQTAGLAGNVGPGLVKLLAQAVPYIDTVTNAAAMTSGADAESDTALRARFVLEANNQARAVESAIAGAVQSVSSAITYKLVENVDSSGALKPGYFYAYVDDGSGAIPGTTITAIAAAVEKARGFTVGYAIVAAGAINADIVIGITVDSGYVASEVRARVQTAVQDYINALAVGSTLYFAQIGIVAGGVAGVSNVTSVTLNGGSANLVPASHQVVRAGTITVNST